MTGRRLNIVVTVGMGPWPFDRLMHGVAPLCDAHDIFVQSGTSTIVLACEVRDFVPFDELQRRMHAADIIITHAGNSVRLAQRMDKLPLAMAREKRFGEMGNDHQVAYLRHEEALGRVAAAWTPEAVSALVANRAEWGLPDSVERPDPAGGAAMLVSAWKNILANPFSRQRDPLSAYLWEELNQSAGPHVHIGAEEDVRPLMSVLPKLQIHVQGSPSAPLAPSCTSVSAGFDLDGEAMRAIGRSLPSQGALILSGKRRRSEEAMMRLGLTGFRVQRRDYAWRTAFVTARADGSGAGRS
ncbi:MAG TPA: hypothetical protein VF475_13135 [Sphingobium sp.]